MPAPRFTENMSLDHTSLSHRLPKYVYVHCDVDPNAAPLLPAAPLTMERFLTFRSAIAFARRTHDGQRRASGSDFVSHPLAVLQILLSTSSSLPHNAYVAGLLHDTLEDGKTSRQDLRDTFGREVEEAVAALTRPKAGGKAHDLENERIYLEQLVQANERYPYVLLIKLADRLHNMETAQFLPPDRRKILFANTLTLYLPVFYAEEPRQTRFLEPYRTLRSMVETSTANQI